MKRNIIKFAILLVTLILNQAAFADVKVKTRQTMSGQTSEGTTYIKGKRMRAEQKMGGMEVVTITQCDLKRSLRVMPQSQVYMIDSWQTAPSVEPSTTKTQTKTKGGVVTSTVTLKDTGERKQMFGYTARRIITTIETDSSPDACNRSKSRMEIDGWYIDQILTGGDGGCYEQRQDYRPPVISGGCQDRYLSKQIGTAKKGYPLSEKTTMFGESGNFTMQTEVIEISNATLDQSLFDVPNGYREVKDANELYAPPTNSDQSSMNVNSKSNPGLRNLPANDSNVVSNVKNNAQPKELLMTQAGEKKAGVVRIGFVPVKTGAVGEGLNAAELAGAVQNTLAEYLKSPNVELLLIEAKLPSAIDAEAKTKECDFVVYASVAHKKGGGGFGMFKKLAPVLSNVAPVAGMGGTGGAIAGQVASNIIYSAANLSQNVKSKDEITLDIKVISSNGAQTLAKQFKQKAKGDGDDLITPIIEQAAQAILDATAKK